MNAPRHDFPPPGIGHNRPCPLCAGDDRDALVEHVAEHLWESRRYGTLDDIPWAECGDHWQRVFRELARTAVEAITAGPAKALSLDMVKR